jgi:hypothetical protein
MECNRIVRKNVRRTGKVYFKPAILNFLIGSHTQPPTQWVLGAVSLRMKRPRREANHSPAKAKNVGAMPSLSLLNFFKELRNPSKYSVRISGPWTEFLMGPPYY